MKIFNKEDFIKLSGKTADPMISIYSPTSRQSSSGYKQDMTHFKNQLSEIKKSLENDYEMPNSKITKLLDPAQELLDNFGFWQNNSDMLACFLSEESGIEIFKLPIETTESSHFIGKKPLLLPMIPELNDDGHYYLLLLNLGRIRLYEATRSVIQEIILDEEEVAISFTAEEEEDENQDQLHGQGGIGNAGTMYHGHDGGSDEVKKVTILNYFHRMTNMLEPLLYKNPLPLYLAGVNYLIPIFRQASKYNHLMEGHVSGAFQEKDMMTLHQKSWEIVEPYFLKERTKRKENFQAKKAEGLAVSNDNMKIIKAALTGAVDTLLVKKNHEHLWGKYDSDTHQINLNDEQENGYHCLIDEAAAKVIEYKGKVYLTEPEDMPEDNLIAATMRYPL